MSAATLDYAALTAHVRAAKAAWREVERNKTWEEKIAAIERMRERDKELRVIRESRIKTAVKDENCHATIMAINRALGL